MNLADLLLEGAECVNSRRFEKATRCFLEALEIDPGNLAALNGLGVSLHELGRLTEAEHFLSHAVRQAPDCTDAHYNLGLVHLEQDRCDEALACFEEILRRKPADADSLAATGIAMERKGEFGEAEEYFAEAARFSRKYAVAGMIRISVEFLRRMDAVHASAPPSAVNSDSAAPREFVVLVACDPVYLRKYGQAFAHSVKEYAGTASLLHLHLLDPGETAVQEARTVMARAGIEEFRISTGDTLRFPPGSRGRAVWYTCARFALLESCLRAYKSPVIVLDVDAAIQRPLASLVNALNSAELGLFFRQPRRAPWLDIRACVLVARPAQATLRFARLLRNYIDHFMQLGAPEWHLDQCALYCTLRMLETRGGAPAVQSISEAADSSLYQIGHSYDARMADPRYARFTSGD